jgi:hypothetical protein
MYYHYNDNMKSVIAVSEEYRHPCMEDERNIPVLNCGIVNGKLYDTTSPEYAKAKQIEQATIDYQNAINSGFEFDGSLYALDDASMNQYTMMKMLADLNQKEPIEVKDMYYNSVFLPAIKYVEFCKKIGERYKTILNTYADKVK